MNRKEASLLGLVLLVAVKNSPAEEVEILLGSIKELDAEEKKKEERLGFRTKPKEDYTI